MSIEFFRGDHFYLSSMYPLIDKGYNGIVIPREGIIVPTVEHGYQADKWVDDTIRQEVLAAKDGFEAKRISNRWEKQGAEMHPEWEANKVDIMRGYVMQKFFRNPELASRLLGTNGQEIYEGNNRGDDFWGVVPIGYHDGGQNWLGRILMETRTDLQREHRNGYHDLPKAS